MVNGMVVVCAPPEIDVTTAEQLRTALIEAAGNGGATVVLDMTGTRFCDCSGLHVLISVHRQARAEGGGLRLVIPADGAVYRVVNLAGLDRLIPSFSGLEQALATSG